MGEQERLSRRGLLKGAAAGGAVADASPDLAPGAQAPAVMTRASAAGWPAARPWPHDPAGADLKPIGGRQVVVRTEATNLCYSNAGAVPDWPAWNAARRCSGGA